MHELTLEALYIYPVKSLRGIALSQATPTPSGLANDRHWAIFKADGRPLTQRQTPALVLISTAIDERGQLRLSAEGHGTINVASPAPDSPRLSFQVFKDTCYGHAASQEVSLWLQDVLHFKEQLQLAKVSTDTARQYANTQRFNVDTHMFADAAPYLVANQKSLTALNRCLLSSDQSPVDMRYFRPNIVVSGIEAFREHEFKRLSTADSSLSLQLADHCQRCAMITVDPDLGKFRPQAQPFTSLSQLNNMPLKPKAPAFGVNASLQGEGRERLLSVGEKLLIE